MTRKRERGHIETPSQTKKLPMYSGCLIMEYIPVVFRVLALGLFVVLPDVPLGTKPTVKTRIANPNSETAKQMPSHRRSG